MDRQQRTVAVKVGPVTLDGILAVPPGARAAVVLAGPRAAPATALARLLDERGVATLAVGLGAGEPEDAAALGWRLERVRQWLAEKAGRRWRLVGLLGEGAAGEAALVTAALRPDGVDCVVCRDSLPELAGDLLEQVRCPTLLSVRSGEPGLLASGQASLGRLRCEKSLAVGASPELEADWLARHLSLRPEPSPWY